MKSLARAITDAPVLSLSRRAPQKKLPVLGAQDAANLPMAYSATHDQRGHSSAVSSVLYTSHTTTFAETKTGSYVYYGDAASFHEWEFRTRMRMSGAGEDKYAEMMSKVVEGLRGDAFIIAQQIGFEKLKQGGDDELQIKPGVDQLIDAMKKSVFPLTTYEAKEMFRQYTKPNGSLSRQSGESMYQYVSRRRRCWQLLKELDKEIELSEGHRAE